MSCDCPYVFSKTGCQLCSLEDRIEKLEKYFRIKLDIDYEKWKEYFENIPTKKPFKCPVCDGTTYHWPENCVKQDCNACSGKGIVWG